MRPRRPRAGLNSVPKNSGWSRRRVLAAATLASWLACASWAPHAARAQETASSSPAVSARTAPAGVRLEFQGDPVRPAFGTVLVTGLDAGALAALAQRSPDAATWGALLPVFTGEKPPEDKTTPPIQGAWSIEPVVIRFTPRFPLATGLTFQARFDGALFGALTGGTGPSVPALGLVFSMPDPEVEPSTHVEAVHPSAELVPENLLRLYVHFSAPMRDQPVAGMVRLYDDQGAPVDLTFVEVPGGLWDPDHRRLTLLFHPGRIKRGVGPHETMGPPLRQGMNYRLEVSAGLLDAQGFPMRESFTASYRVGAADRISPDPTAWRLTLPSDARSPVSLDLPEPMDCALMLRLVGVQDEQGAFVRGEATLSSGETRWIFTPAEPWRPGPYAVVIDPALEDLAGNTPLRLFDAESGAAGATRSGVQTRPIMLRFTIAATD